MQSLVRGLPLFVARGFEVHLNQQEKAISHNAPQYHARFFEIRVALRQKEAPFAVGHSGRGCKPLAVICDAGETLKHWIILWMDEILHHLRTPRMMVPL